jgi:hypothetical protein
LYFFQREDSHIRCEVRLDLNGVGYELVIDTPDAVRVERFMETDDLNRRWSELEKRLVSEGWSGPAGLRMQ